MHTIPPLHPVYEIKNLDTSRIPELYGFFQRFFPPEELFSWNVFRKAAANGITWIVEDEEHKLLGALTACEMEKFLYGMFLAVEPKMRKKGIADSLIRKLLSYSDQTKKPLTGEIEPIDPLLPFTAIRAEMYQRMGFKINPQPYQAPNCVDTKKNEKYYLISYPRLLTQAEFDSFTAQICRIYTDSMIINS